MFKILIVDDEQKITTSLKNFFSLRGYDVTGVFSGKEALEKFETERPEIVFLDIKMQEVDGLQVLREIRKKDANTKVIIISAWDEPETRKEAQKIGYDAFLVKPFSVERLEKVALEKIQELMEKPSILVVDDDEKVVAKVKEYLEFLGWKVYASNDGETALDIIKKNTPGVVFLDIKMEGMDGVKVLKEIKRIDPSIKVIMISAYGDKEAQINMRDFGCDAYLEKPLTNETIKKALTMKVQEISGTPNILVVDDQQGARSTVIEFLKDRIKANYFEANGGREALEKIENENCNIMILDLNMPDIDGFKVIEETQKINAHIDILVATAYSDNEVFDKIMCNGVIDFLLKPFSLRALESKIKAMLKRRGFKIVSEI
ncbi:MAG: response regulator [Candidatus Omnitrophica bacterium]|nr:response regulator [Candidatus Omnitrophota bacterium]